MTFHRGQGCIRACTVLAFALLGRGAPALDLHATAAEPTDLAVAGLLEGVGPTEMRYLRWSELAALPTTKLTLDGEFLPGTQEVTVVFLEDLWRALPVATPADTLLASCADGYASVYARDFVGAGRPFLILAINGQGPEHWPPPGLKFNPGPYVISVSAAVAPAVAGLLDPGHKKPWGVNALRFVRQEDAFAGIFHGTRARLSPRAQAGRGIWINSCASCHRGPDGVFGGTKSDRPFEVLAAYAVHSPDYFKGYVRHPQTLSPAAKMEAHPHYNDEQLAALIAFLGAEPPG